MRIALLGATGGLGTAVLARLLACGAEVTALVRREGAVTGRGVHEIVGDARDRAAIAETLSGVDAVVDVLGGGTLKHTDLESSAIALVVDEMARAGQPKRLIAMSAGMVAPSFLLMDVILKPTVFRHILAEHRRVETIVRESNLDWTIVRPPRLVDGPASGYAASIGDRYRGAVSVTRADVAEFIVEEIRRGEYVRRAVFVSRAR